MGQDTYYSVDPCDVSVYGYELPTIPEGLLLVDCLNDQLSSLKLDCQTILKEISRSTSGPSGLHSVDGTAMIDTYHRSSSFHTAPDDTYRRVADRLTFTVNHHLQQLGKFKLCEAVQFLRYDESNSGHFKRHTDSAYWHGPDFKLTCPQRKISTITYLNDDYEGGELVLDTVKDPAGNIFKKKMAPGTMIIFPSDLRFPHEVLPVTKGSRFSIVAWYDVDK